MGKNAQRLFETFQPENYQLHLSPSKTSLTFSGTVTIKGKKVGRPNKRITFHQKGLKIRSATLVKHDKKGELDVPVIRINTHDTYNEIRLHSESMLYPGEYTITLEFEGKILEQMVGIYPCHFEHNGEKKMLIATQFESHHAREAFPCIDEPEAKATFDLTLTSPVNETVLANTPVKEQSTHNDEVSTLFEKTPRMSTYLLAFVIGELQSVERKTKDGITVKSWSTPAQPLSHLDYSADEAVRYLEFFTDYFGVPYPLQKCDQVALPDFDSGAMENWGLITYREIALLTDDQNRSVSNEQYISMVIAHELSHQWFGNLVTMKWWDDLWLNESFASLMEHIALDAVHPDWHQWESYVSSDITTTSSRDVYSDIQPVGVEVTDPDVIHTLFDPGIVYSKGGRLLKMLREFIGDEAFTNGLRNYFTKHAYKNATREDLWAALSDSSCQDISALMTPWLINPGMPVVKIAQQEKTLTLNQERFLLDDKPDSTVWPIPLLTDDLPQAILTSQSNTFDLLKPEYVVLNQSGSGHYFTHYTETSHREHIAKRIQEQSLSPETRMNILNDMYMLARKGEASVVDGLEVVMASKDEPRDHAWTLLLRLVGAASQLTEGSEHAEKSLKALRCNLARDWHEKLGWNDSPEDDSNTKQLRQTMVSLMIGGEDKAAIGEAQKRFAEVDDLQSLPAELRASILAANVRSGDTESVVARLLKEYPSATADVQLDITGAVTATKDPVIGKKILEQAIGKNGFVRTQDIMRWLAYALRNRYMRQEAWEFITQNWDRIKALLDNSKSYDFLPIYCANVITTEEWSNKYTSFFEPLINDKSLHRNILVGSADIAARIAWRTRDEQAILAWLEKNVT